MSLSATCESVSQKRTLSSLLAGRVVKRPKQEEEQRLFEATIQLLEQQHNPSSLLREVGNPDLHKVFGIQNGEEKHTESEGISSVIAGSLLVCELRRQASQLGVPVVVQAVKIVLERLMEITATKDVEEEEYKRRGLLTISQRVQLCALLESTKELLSQGALCPKLLWQEYRRDQRAPKLEVVYYLHFYKVLSLKYILESDGEVRLWLVSQLKSLCRWTPSHGEDETKQIQQKVLSTVVGVLVGTGFERSHEPAAADKRISLLCCSVLDDMLFWFLDAVEKSLMQQTTEAGAELWFCGFLF